MLNLISNKPFKYTDISNKRKKGYVNLKILTSVKL